jgi:hypothetical protein
MPTRSVRRSIAPALAAGAVALAAGGCGSGQATLDPIAQAAEATTHSGGSQVALTVQIRSPELTAPVTVKGSGDFNMSHGEGEFFLDFGSVAAAAGKQLPPGTATLTELIKGGSLYMRSALFEGKLPGGAKWLKLDLERLSSGIGADPSALANGQSNPAELLSYLRASGGSVRAVGHEAVRGTETTHYAGTVDLAKAAEALAGTNRAQLRATFQKLIAEAGTSRLPVQVWVDGHRLVRRMSMQLPVPSGGRSASASVDFEMFGFGPTPAVNPPAGSETFDATKLSLQALSAGG